MELGGRGGGEGTAGQVASGWGMLGHSLRSFYREVIGHPHGRGSALCLPWKEAEAASSEACGGNPSLSEQFGSPTCLLLLVQLQRHVL